MDADFKLVMLERCYSDKSTMTPQRLLILDTLVELKKPISAYELKDYLNGIGKSLNIASIYRILEFWCGLKLVHRIRSKNKFISCSVPEDKHTHVINFCQRCEKTIESCHEKMGIDIEGGAKTLGLKLANNSHLEIPVYCSSCR